MFTKYIEGMEIMPGISYNWDTKILFFKVVLGDHRFQLRFRYSAIKTFHLSYQHWTLSDERALQERFINAK